MPFPGSVPWGYTWSMFTANTCTQMPVTYSTQFGDTSEREGEGEREKDREWLIIRKNTYGICQVLISLDKFSFLSVLTLFWHRTHMGSSGKLLELMNWKSDTLLNAILPVSSNLHTSDATACKFNGRKVWEDDRRDHRTGSGWRVASTWFANSHSLAFLNMSQHNALSSTWSWDMIRIKRQHGVKTWSTRYFSFCLPELQQCDIITTV